MVLGLAALFAQAQEQASADAPGASSARNALTRADYEKAKLVAQRRAEALRSREVRKQHEEQIRQQDEACLLYTSPSPRDS